METPEPASLNEHQVRRLRVTCQHIDKLLSDIEYTLNESASKTAFPHYIPDIPPAQRRTIEDHIARIRAQLVRVLDGQGIPREEPTIPASRSVHIDLVSIDITVEELKPKYMRGHGDVPPNVAVELNGIVGELHNIVARLDRYVTKDAGQDLQVRLQRLEQAGNNLQLLSRIERVVADWGLVEYRGTITSIIERAEDRNFEIAVFGRVSSGKSSLLNTVIDTDVLPVGVTPITSVPTRIAYGEKPGIAVSFTDSSPKSFDIARLGEYATEQQNPENTKHVARILVQLPSSRLRDGVSFMDTPGLGSLATKGAAETLAYLPECDLGVVLVDSGSTLTAEDVQTILALQEAAVPVHVLLSKVDLLSLADCEKMIRYVKEHIAMESNLELAVHAVSVLPSHLCLLHEWFEHQILPLYNHSQELKDASLRRKIGVLRESVTSALRIRLQRGQPFASGTPENIRAVEARLRQSLGSIETTRSACECELEEIRGILREISWETAARVIKGSTQNSTQRIDDDELVRSTMIQVMQHHGKKVQSTVEELAIRLSDTLRDSAEDLDLTDKPETDEFLCLVRGIPVFDPGAITLSLPRPSKGMFFGKQPDQKRLAEQIQRRLLATPVERLLDTYVRGLKDWLRTVTGDLGRMFELYAERYRAHAEQLLSSQELSPNEIQDIENDLRSLESF